MFLYKCHPNAAMPTRNTREDSGWDFYSTGGQVIVRPGEIVKVPTGLCLACPVNAPGWVWDKSGRASEGLKVLGGVIDQFYVGEISIILGNMNLWNILRLLQEDLQGEDALMAFTKAISDSTITIEPGKAVAQMVFHSVVDLQEIRELPEEQFRKEFRSRFDARGTKGFGSSDTVPTLLSPGVTPLPRHSGVSQEVLKKINDSPQTEEQIGHLRAKLLEHMAARPDEPERVEDLMKGPPLQESEDRSC